MKHNGIHNVVYILVCRVTCIISVLHDGNKAAALPLLQTHTGRYRLFIQTHYTYRLLTLPPSPSGPKAGGLKPLTLARPCLARPEPGRSNQAESGLGRKPTP